MDKTIVILGKKALRTARNATLKATDSLSQVSNVALERGNQVIIKARVLIADTFEVISDK